MPHDTLIITDSRGSDLQRFVLAANTNSLPVDIVVHEYKGAGLAHLANMAAQHSRRQPEYVCYIAGGICDFTHKNQQTKVIEFPHGNQSMLLSYVKAQLDEADRITHSLCPESKFVICPLVGAEVEKYIPDVATELPDLQDIFNNSVTELNYYILNINQERGCRMPYLSTPVHKWKHQKYYHDYSLMYKDGVHLTNDLKASWGAAFIKAIERN